MSIYAFRTCSKVTKMWTGSMLQCEHEDRRNILSHHSSFVKARIDSNCTPRRHFFNWHSFVCTKQLGLCSCLFQFYDPEVADLQTLFWSHIPVPEIKWIQMKHNGLYQSVPSNVSHFAVMTFVWDPARRKYRIPHWHETWTVRCGWVFWFLVAK